MAERPRVLELLGPSTGGIRRHVSFLRDHLGADGWSIATAGPEGVLDPLDHVVPVPRGIHPGQVAAARRALAAAVRGYDLVHAHGLTPGWLASLVRDRPPLVVSLHNVVLPEVAGRSAALLQRLEARLPARADRTIAVSRGIADRFAGRPGADRIVVIPPAGPVPRPQEDPATVRRRLGVRDADDLVVTPARLTAQKDLYLLLDVAERVVAERPGLRWFVFGDGVLRGELEADIARRGLGGVVHLAGTRPDVDSELAAADVVAVTSRWESGPLVVLEALALGRPVVSTRVGLVPDAVRPPHGRVVEVGDAPGFARALVEVLGATADAASVSPPAEFTPAALADRVAAVYRSVAEQR